MQELAREILSRRVHSEQGDVLTYTTALVRASPTGVTREPVTTSGMLFPLRGTGLGREIEDDNNIDVELSTRPVSVTERIGEYTGPLEGENASEFYLADLKQILISSDAYFLQKTSFTLSTSLSL